MSPLPAPPSPVDIVSSGEVEGAMREVADEIATLERALADALAEADVLEGQLGSPVDLQTYQFVAIRLNHFLTGLRAEANTEMSALVAAADGQDRRREAVKTSFAHLVRERAQGPNVARAPDLALLEPAPAEPAPAEPAPPVPEAVAEAAPAAVAEPAYAPVGEVAHAAPTDRALEEQFWADLDRETTRSHLWRSVRAVGFQALAVLVLITAVLLRVG